MAVLVGLVVSVAGTGAAEAASPGRNGRIAFISEGWIYLVNADGSSLSQLAETSSDDTSGGVSFSADGQLVAYSAYKGSDPDIYSVRVDGSKRRQVTFSRGIDVDPSWSPKADRIAFETNRNGNFDIYSVDPAGRNPLRLTNAAENEQDPAWSPKGDKIAFTVEAVGGKLRQIWLMNADGSNKQQLTNAPRRDARACRQSRRGGCGARRGDRPLRAQGQRRRRRTSARAAARRLRLGSSRLLPEVE